MTIIGQLLLCVGFLGAALASVCRIESEDFHPWQTIPWNWYGVSMAIGVVGVVVLRISSKAAAQHAGRVDGEFEILVNSLATLQKNIADLSRKQDTTELHETVTFIDRQCAEPFSDFADSRNALIQRFGLQGFAEVMTQFSSAERFVNRAWSAAADGYRNETKSSLEIAENHLSRASKLMDKYQSGHQFDRDTHQSRM